MGPMQQNQADGVLGCLSWDAQSSKSTKAPKTAVACQKTALTSRSSISTTCSNNASALVERIAQAKEHCASLYAEGRRDEFNQLAGMISEMEAKLKAMQGPETRRSRADNMQDSMIAVDPARAQAYHEARQSAKAVKNRNKGGNPLAWD